VTPIGIDIDSRQVEQAKKHSCEIAFERSNEQLEQAVLNLTNGQGADAIIITAATSSNDPIDLAGTLCRKKGSVVIVGAVPTGFQRKNYYIKELQLKMSCSYGPGRYDAGYEEQGNDYPYAYVRWTENRNMQAFADLMAAGKIQIKPLITHTFPFSEAKNAYDLILKKTEPFSGIVLQYDVEKTVSSRLALKNHPHLQTTAKVGMIGAGSFGQNFLLPALKGKVTLTGIATARPNNARNVADKFGFSYCSGDASEIIADPDTNTIFIATRHDLHAEFVKAAIREKCIYRKTTLFVLP
jgi:polar amino acid transport system substrate-binding protein